MSAHVAHVAHVLRTLKKGRTGRLGAKMRRFCARAHVNRYLLISMLWEEERDLTVGPHVRTCAFREGRA
jgi:hypothetical protein